MFSSCLGVHGASDVKNEKIRGHDGDHGGAWRLRVRSWLHCLWPFGEKEKTLSQGSQDQDRSDQVEKESAPIVRKKTAPEERKESVPNDLEKSGLRDAKEHGPKEPGMFAPNEPKESCFNTLDVLVDNMLTAVQDGDHNSLIAFLCVYPMCATIQQILNVIFRRYAYFRPECEEDEEVKNVICTLLHTWMDEFPGDFSNTTDLSFLKKAKTYLMLNMPHSDLLVHFHEIHMNLEAEVDSDSEESE